MSDLHLHLIQTAPFWEDIPKNLNLFQKKMRHVQKGEIVVLPEMFNTGFSMNAPALAETMEGDTLHWMKKQAKKHGVILTGSVIIKEHQRFYNRLLWVLPNGKVAHYDKRHLFSYVGEDQVFTPGKERILAQVNGWKIALIICYDLRFPVWIRQHGEVRYDLLIVMANWPTNRIDAWDALLRARAIENQCFVAGVNRIGPDGKAIKHNGHSAVYGPTGASLAQLEDLEDSLKITLNKDSVLSTRKKFPFLNDADPFLIVKD